MVIYLVRNKVNNKIYIGKTVKPFTKRWTSHCWHAKNSSGHALHAAIRKYGLDNFQISILDETAKSEDELKALEILYIKQYQAKGPTGYNLTEGGDGTCGFRWPKEARERMSATLKIAMARPEVKEKLSAAAKGNKRCVGRKFSPETIVRMSAKRKGKSYWVGKKHSEETKKLLSDQRIGKRPSVETRMKMSATKKRLGLKPPPRYGKQPPRSAEWCRKLSDAAKRRCARPQYSLFEAVS